MAIKLPGAVENLPDHPGPTNWTEVWSEVLDCKIKVPPVPKPKDETAGAIERFNFRMIFIPKITVDDYPDGFIKIQPVWGKHLDEAQIKCCPLPGRWVAIETIAKPDWDDEGGYGGGNDPLAAELGLESRFGISWDDLKSTHLPKVANLFGVCKTAARLPSTEEWNLAGNLFNWLRNQQGENLPDLGSTRSWEWCVNTYGSGLRLTVGNSGSGGLASVSAGWSDSLLNRVAFRVVVVL